MARKLPRSGEPAWRQPRAAERICDQTVVAELIPSCPHQIPGPAEACYEIRRAPRGGGGHAPIPASAYNVAAQLLAIEADVDQSAPSARVHLSDGLWMTLRAARIGESGPKEGRNIAVTIEETSPPERVALFARVLGLSALAGARSSMSFPR